MDTDKQFILGILAFCVALFFVAIALSDAQCKGQWEGNKKIEAVEYSFIAGCRVKVNGNWMPAKNYRTLDAE